MLTHPCGAGLQGFKRKVGTAASDAAEVGDKIVDADTADCSGNNKDCSSRYTQARHSLQRAFTKHGRDSIEP